MIAVAYVVRYPLVAGGAATLNQVRAPGNTHQQQYRHTGSRQGEVVCTVEQAILGEVFRRYIAALLRGNTRQVVFQAALSLADQYHVARRARSLQNIQGKVGYRGFQRVHRVHRIGPGSHQARLLGRP